MPLVDLKSNLARRDSTTTDDFLNTDAPGFTAFRLGQKTEFKVIENNNLSTTDDFLNINASGFTAFRLGQRNTEFKITKRTANVAYVNNTVDSGKSPSPIEISHNTAKIQFSNPTEGGPSTRNISGYPLGQYYSQLNGTETQLGIRKSKKFGPDQPYVVREIGDTWDINNSFEPSGFSGLNRDDAKLTKTAKEINSNSVRFGSFFRLDKFLASPQGVLFLNNQREFMKGNAQKFRTDVRYGITGGENTLFGTAGFGDLNKVDQNPRKYDINSLASQPGIKSIDILADDPSLTLGFGVAQTIASTISETLLAKATTAADKVTRNLTGVGLDIANRIGDRLLDRFDEETGLVTKAKRFEAKVDAFNTVLGIDGTDVSKIKGIVLGDNKVFADVGKDLVNLIPYGSDEIKGRSYKDLDFIPFKFYDVNNDKSIVFRAILSGITDTFTPEYSSERYIGRPDNVYVYSGTTREISFTFDVYPKSDEELLVLWEKMNYLAGLTYPSYDTTNTGMIAPFCKLTLGQMYDNTSGYISGLTYTVMDSSTWETTFAKLPKYIQASCTFVYIGDRLPSSTQKHFEGPWIAEEEYQSALSTLFGDFSVGGVSVAGLLGGDSSQALEATDKILNDVGL